MNLNRRSVLKGIGATTVSLVSAGLATARTGQAQYVVLASGSGKGGRTPGGNFHVTRELAGGRVLVVHGPAGEADALRSQAGVEAAVRDRRLKLEGPALTEPLESDGDADSGESDWYENLWDKQRNEVLAANDVATGAGTHVGIIDTGIDYVHPDLTTLAKDAGRRFKNGEIDEGVESEIVVNNPAGPDEPDPEEDPEKSAAVQVVDQHVASDVQGHGTHVGGIVAADPESGVGGFFGTGVQGVAPDAALHSYRVFWWEFFDSEDDPGWGLTTTTGDILTAIDYAAANGLDVLNMSLGTTPIEPRAHSEELVRVLRLAYERTVRAAVNRGTVVVASAGNAGADLQRGGTFSLPNSTNGAISVSALGPGDDPAFFTNTGTNEIDVGAGGGAYETYLKTLYGIREWVFAGMPLRWSDHPLDAGDEGELWFDEDDELTFDPNEVATVIEFESPAWPYPFNLVFSTTSPLNDGAPYGWKAGTSMSAPNTAGLVALVRELAPDASPAQVESAIKKGAQGGTGRSDPGLGAGRINAAETVRLLDRNG